MQKFKKFMAVALAATMVVGSSVTAFAEDETPATSGSTSGAGTSEGHLDKHVVKVTLPTIAEGTSPFAYTMDLERLIQETDAKKYAESTTFPEEASDTGVYFLTAEKTYANESKALTVTSESSADVKLTVDVEVTSAATDVTLVDEAPASDATEPQLYLALKVGDQTKAVKKGEKVSAEVTLAGKADNFETSVVDGAYVYKAKADATGWSTADISVTGAASKASAEGLTAPTLQVTWSWTDLNATSAGTNVAAVAESGDTDVLVRLVSGQNANASKITSVTVNGAAVASGNIAVSGSGNIWLKNVVSGAGTYKIVIVYDGVTYTGTFTKS